MRTPSTTSPIRRHRKALLVVAGVLIIGGVIAFGLSHRHNLAANQLPGVDYSPATVQDNKSINDRKTSSGNDNKGGHDTNDSVTLPANSPIGITLAAAGQDTARGPVVIKAMLTRATRGTCSLHMTSGSQVIDKQAAIVQQGNYFSCDGFSIPYTDVTPGDWHMTLTVKTAEGSKSVDQTITVQ
jgi:hypothetical protein